MPFTVAHYTRSLAAFYRDPICGLLIYRKLSRWTDSDQPVTGSGWNMLKASVTGKW
ncbi:MAG: hypothetical protein U0905_06620 [Pirellulales bacterium]